LWSTDNPLGTDFSYSDPRNTGREFRPQRSENADATPATLSAGTDEGLGGRLTLAPARGDTVRHPPQFLEVPVKPILVAVLGLLGLGALLVLGSSSDAREAAARDWWR
jgi:hypothetical protein